MSSFDIMALTPPSFEQREAFQLSAADTRACGNLFRASDAAIAAAASFAGQCGIINLEFTDLAAESITELIAAIKSIKSRPDTVCGIKCTIDQLAELHSVLSELSLPAADNRKFKGRNRVVLVSASDRQALAKSIKEIQKYGLSVLVEAVSISEAEIASASGADGIIAKGHEAAGRVGEQTTFILLQECLRRVKLPIWAEGGIGLDTASACLVAGAAGVVLDCQLLLTRESQLPFAIKSKIAAMDGSESHVVAGNDGKGEGGSEKFRLFFRAGHAIDKLSDQQADVQTNKQTSPPAIPWRRAIAAYGLQPNALDRVWVFGQDICFAHELSRQYTTVAGIIEAITRSASDSLTLALKTRHLQEGAPLAVSHNTRYPIVQGAMTRVSDTAEFAQKVAEGGGLPFLALALMRKNEIEPLVSRTKELLQNRSWGVGILGFVPNELRQEQLAVIREYKPPYALIAGGRPDQAKTLEDIGIKTYLHVPSPMLLESFIEMGSRRFIFEGKECGGHVGPRSSFILWQSMVSVLLATIGANDGPDYHVLFAGGIHDDLSAAMVGALSARLADRGVRVGMLMGTAYLFTHEAVTTGAIVRPFQDAAIKCAETVLFETGPGHAIRCIDSPYKRTFDQKRQELTLLNKSRDQIREELELMNLGRLRIASKGLNRAGATNKQQAIAEFNGKSEAAKAPLSAVPDKEQWDEGMYMIGQVASMHDKTCSIEELHAAVANGATQRIADFASTSTENISEDKRQYGGVALVKSGTEKAAAGATAADGIAIVGMSCFFPKAKDLESYWQNIINKVDTITEVPAEQWDWREYYDENPLARDKIYSKWGGFLENIKFDPTTYGIPPSSLASIDPMQVMLLELTRSVLADAGYTERAFARDRTSVVLANAGHGPITALYSLRSMLGWKLAGLDESAKETIKKQLPEWTEDSFPGYLGNVTAGRVANRFDLGGINFSIDAACASSLAALYVSVGDLRSRRSDVALLCAVDTHNQPGDYLSFSKTHAFSRSGRCRTFDATADGIVISEGMAMIMLKRLADAEKDGDKIYAVIRGVGGSSDGRDLSLTAPRPAGQVSALKRAYADANLSPHTVTLIEAHGTGTVAGDRAEIEALKQVFTAAGADKRGCAVGSVKTMIGHTKAAAGLASLIKVAKALHHKVLPPTIGVETPSPACDFENSPFYINSEARPWFNHNNDGQSAGLEPRRAGVSAFGFGGTNFHVVVEEYVPSIAKSEEPCSSKWPSELFLVKGRSRAELLKNLTWLDALAKKTSEIEDGNLRSVAYQLYLKQLERFSEPVQSNENEKEKEAAELTMALVADSFEDLKEKLSRGKSDLIDNNKKNIIDPRGIYFFERAANVKPAKIAFLFPGQGSQQLDMLKDLSLQFPEVRAVFERTALILSNEFQKPLYDYIYPPPAFSDEEKKAQHKDLTDTKIAQPAVGAADLAMLSLLTAMGIAPDMVAGHSYGEYVALCAAGALKENDLIKISAERGRLLSRNRSGAGAMAAVACDAQTVREFLDKMPGVTLANLNAPQQCVISGQKIEVEAALAKLNESGINARFIPVSQAFHSPQMHDACQPLKDALRQLQIQAARIPVYSNEDGGVYPEGVSAIIEKLSDHVISPVDFVNEIRQMYEAGGRIFVEVGPQAVLTGLAESILKEDGRGDALVVPTDRNGRHGITQLQHAIGQIAAQGVAIDLGILFRNRTDEKQALNQLQPTMKPLGTQRPRLLFSVNSVKITPIAPATKLVAPASVTRSGKSDVTLTQLDGGQGKPAIKIFNERNQEAKFLQDGVEVKRSGNGSPVKQAKLTAEHQESTQSIQVKPEERSLPMPPAGQSPRTFMESVHDQSFNAPVSNNGHGQPAHVDQVMLRFQETMLQMTQSFLQTQQQVMLSYLQTRGSAMPNASSLFAVPRSQAPLMQPRIDLNVTGPRHGAPLAGTSLNGAPFENAAKSNRAVAGLPAQANFGQQEIGVATTNLPIGKKDNNGHGNAHAALQTDSSGAAQNAGAATAANETGLDADALVAALLDIVSQRTGYPPEMLDPTLDLEADLGIDSIKRVEILNSFRRILPAGKQAQLEGGIEELAGTKTLSGIIDWIKKTPNNSSSESAVAAVPVAVEHIDNGGKKAGDNGHGHGNGSDNNGHQVRNLSELANLDDSLKKKLVPDSELKRALVQVVELPDLAEFKSRFSGTVIVAANETDFAAEISALLSEMGAKAVIMRHAENTKETNGVYFTNLVDNSEISTVLTDIEQKHGQITGLIHAISFGRSENNKGLDHLGIRSMFNMSKALVPQFEKLRGDAFVAAVTRLGGDFRSSCREINDSVCATQAAVTGFIKSLAKEFPELNAKAIDFAAAVKAKDAARLVCNEIAAKEKRVEVGYGNGKRFGLDVKYAPLNRSQNNKALSTFDQQPVMLITGGARGITAEIAASLAQYYKPILIIVGKAAPPENEEESDTIGLSSARELKAAIMDRFRRDGKPLSIQAVEQAYNKLLRDREIRNNLAKLKDLGATVVYKSCDVRDGEHFAELIADVYRDYGTIYGVIHGAGVIEDAFIKQKNVESFDRVYQTKVDGALTLSRSLDLDALRFLVFFSSVVGRTGNAGQSDYVAANEVVNKLAIELDGKTNARVVSIMWGPWKGGMAGSELESIFASYGWAMIASEDGKQAFMEELLHGKKGEVEVLAVAELKKRPGAPEPAGARLHKARVQTPSAGISEFHLTLDTQQDLYLLDHTFDNVPVMPMAFALELMAEAVKAVYPEMQIASVYNLDIPSGIVFDATAKSIVINIEESTRSEHACAVNASLDSTYPRRREHFKAQFEIVRADEKDKNLQAIAGNGHLPEAIPHAIENIQELCNLNEAVLAPPTISDIYHKWLFHGPKFQHIDNIDAMGDDGIVGRLHASSPGTLLAEPGSSEWIIDPILFDSAMQLAGVWARHYLDITALPTGFRKLHIFNGCQSERYFARAFMNAGAAVNELSCDIAVYGANGDLAFLIEGLGGVGSKSLNRLSGQPANTVR